MAKKNNKTKPDSSLVIAETTTSSGFYHLRRVSNGKLYPSGGAPPAICGRSLGWDTDMSLDDWGRKSHLTERWCLDCASVASDELVKTALLPAMDIAKKGLKPDGYVSTLSFKSLGSLDGRPRYKTAAAAAKSAIRDLARWENAGLDEGELFLVGLVSRSASWANGCFTEVLVLGNMTTYEIFNALPRRQRKPKKV